MLSGNESQCLVVRKKVSEVHRLWGENIGLWVVAKLPSTQWKEAQRNLFQLRHSWYVHQFLQFLKTEKLLRDAEQGQNRISQNSGFWSFPSHFSLQALLMIKCHLQGRVFLNLKHNWSHWICSHHSRKWRETNIHQIVCSDAGITTKPQMEILTGSCS